MLYAIVGMLVIILDQGVKYWVTNNIMLNTVTEPLIPGILSLVRMHNDGAAFSFLAGGGARIYFVILTGIFTVAVIIALVTHFINGKFGRWCLVLVTAGALSNCLDRILYGFVVDMFKIDLFDFAVFNVADIFITVFSLLFIIYIIFGGERDRNGERDEFDEFDDEEADSRSLTGELRDNVDSVMAQKKSKKSRRYEEEEERPRKADHRAAEETEEPALRPMRKPKVIAPSEKRTSTELPEYQPKTRTSAPERKSAPAYAEDPFEAWEDANARAESTAASSPAAKAMGTAPAKSRPAVRQSEYEEEAPVRSSAKSRSAAQKSEYSEAAPVKSVAPKTQPKAKKSEDDFDLDDILAEFK